MDREKIEKIAEHYGYDCQSRQCIEEMAELTQAINKLWRVFRGRRDFPKGPNGLSSEESFAYYSVAEELADVKITVAQIEYLLGSTEIVQNMTVTKLDRQLKRMEAENGR